jgi:hypothetical protein
MNYTLIINMPDGCSTCRQCVMDSWHSDFNIHTDIDESSAVDKIAKTFAGKHGDDYTAYLIGVIGDLKDKDDYEMRTPSEQVVFEFSRSYDMHKQKWNTIYNICLSSHYNETNNEFVEAELIRITKLINEAIKNINPKNT